MRCILKYMYVPFTVTKVFLSEAGETTTHYLYFILFLVQVPTWPSAAVQKSWEAVVFLRVSFIHPSLCETNVYTVTITEISALLFCVKNHNATLPDQPWYKPTVLLLKNILIISHILVLGDANLEKCAAYICVNMVLQKFSGSDNTSIAPSSKVCMATMLESYKG
jgi:hypothetical protein